MANEIYDSSWWGNTIDTASSIGTSTEMIQGQFNLTKIGAEKVVNGDFATDTSWTKGTGVTISGGKANWTNTINNVGVTQSGIITSGKNYKVVFTVSNYFSGSVRVRFPSITERLTSNGTYTYYINATDTDLYIQGETNGDANVNFSIDNVSVKEVRASSVEAVKCLADAIHRIGIQNIQN
jgi:hypothetical protein